MAWLDNLQAYWALDAASGNETDLHNGHVLVATNAPGSAAGRTYATARHFSLGAGQVLSMADHAHVSFGDVPWTIGFEVYLDGLAGFDYGILQKGSDTEYKIQKNGGNYLEQYVWSGPGSLNNNPAALATAATWISVLMWHDPTLNLIGVVQDGTEYTQSWSNGTLDSTGDFKVGSNSMDGRIGAVAVWGRLMTAPEKAAWPLTYAAMGGGGGGGADVWLLGANTYLGVA